MTTTFQLFSSVCGAVLAVLITPGVLQAEQIQLDVGLSKPVMLKCDQSQKSENHLRIALRGFELESDKARLPVNVAIVIDKSGSMHGDKIRQAREAAVHAVERLHEDDIVSIVAYDTSVSVLVPATKATHREEMISLIRAIQPGGNTALHAGVEKGAAEVRKFLDDNRVNRVILLSDGLANVGPSKPGQLEQLGAALIKEGISVTTMGLGLQYNEDLMTRLAIASSGNHVFIEDEENLVQVFQNEFDDVLSVVAQKLDIHVRLAKGVRPVKLLNYPATIDGQDVHIELGQLISHQQRYFVLELEVPCGVAKEQLEIGKVEVKYHNMVTEAEDRLASRVQVRFTDSESAVESAINQEVMAACVLQIANQANCQATQLRDEGKVEEARRVLLENAEYLQDNYDKLGAKELEARSEQNRQQAGMLESGAWAKNRKSMRELQSVDATQQSYLGSGAKSSYGEATPRK